MEFFVVEHGLINGGDLDVVEREEVLDGNSVLHTPMADGEY